MNTCKNNRKKCLNKAAVDFDTSFVKIMAKYFTIFKKTKNTLIIIEESLKLMFGYKLV